MCLCLITPWTLIHMYCSLINTIWLYLHSTASVHIHPRCSSGGAERQTHWNIHSEYPQWIQEFTSSTPSYQTNQNGGRVWCTFLTKSSWSKLGGVHVLWLQCLNKLENVKESQFQGANRNENIPKNRFQTILPCMYLSFYHAIYAYMYQMWWHCMTCLVCADDKYRVRLQPKPYCDDPSDYINASYLDVCSWLMP